MYVIFDNWKTPYEQVNNNRFCTCSICSSLWFVKYNSRFCNENTNFKYAFETDKKKNVGLIRLRAEETKEHNQTS